MKSQLSRPFSQACENNKAPILAILKSAFAPCKQVLEIGSGTGQHAVFFAQALAKLKWQPSDRRDNHKAINQWLSDYKGSNMLPLLELEIGQSPWPKNFDAVFSANTLHIMPWPIAQRMLQELASHLPVNGVFAVYGPFNYGGHFTSDSNAQFDIWLKERGAHQGIRDFEAVARLLEAGGLTLVRDHAMPSNNRLLVWKKLS